MLCDKHLLVDLKVQKRRVFGHYVLELAMPLDNGHARQTFSTNLSLLDNRCRTLTQQCTWFHSSFQAHSQLRAFF